MHFLRENILLQKIVFPMGKYLSYFVNYYSCVNKHDKKKPVDYLN